MWVFQIFLVLICSSLLSLTTSFGHEATLEIVNKDRRRSPLFQVASSTPGGEPPTQLSSSDLIADSLEVQRGLRAPRLLFKFSWRVHGYCLPLLHAYDKAQTKDLDYSLKCLWCKALSGLDPRSPTFDEGLTYDMLPSGTRRILRFPNRFFPRLIHFNIELRTAFLDRALLREIEVIGSRKKIQLITLGAGYDTRSVRFLTSGQVQEAWELDVSPVISSKKVMFDRLVKRRQERQLLAKLPSLLVQDLNEVEEVEREIFGILDSCHDKHEWHIIFILEGVLIYLNEGVPTTLLSSCSSILKQNKFSGSLIFADLIRGLESSDVDRADHHLAAQGWDLERSSWCVKPGLARHMGLARVDS